MLPELRPPLPLGGGGGGVNILVKKNTSLARGLGAKGLDDLGGGRVEVPRARQREGAGGGVSWGLEK